MSQGKCDDVYYPTPDRGIDSRRLYGRFRRSNDQIGTETELRGFARRQFDIHERFQKIALGLDQRLLDSRSFQGRFHAAEVSPLTRQPNISPYNDLQLSQSFGSKCSVYMVALSIVTDQGGILLYRDDRRV